MNLKYYRIRVLWVFILSLSSYFNLNSKPSIIMVQPGLWGKFFGGGVNHGFECYKALLNHGYKAHMLAGKKGVITQYLKDAKLSYTPFHEQNFKKNYLPPVKKKKQIS